MSYTLDKDWWKNRDVYHGEKPLPKRPDSDEIAKAVAATQAARKAVKTEQKPIVKTGVYYDNELKKWVNNA